ncbi:transcriptional regulator WhiD [Kitasatospora herbaricolor]|uniref:WhiB family transcriptional regulator n=1 Tax=Kitasatospora herbaricolor TaxID=68217 RepID=UPI00174ECC95|nr:WhiB family transcriptional regulator [Kitasatospora herbaricolor]MDQ0312902.1 WhiB family redox-sensing transcriptional regulator [Kitasatospora herbaricolor]GGV48490.1 transcriptional regulator WhiD [Kitasatospora herbaricolor]
MTDLKRLPGAFDHHWNWQLAAACRAVDTGLFFHPFGERGQAHDDREAEAKKICGGCPVRAQCLRHALEVREPYGVWGGLSEGERAELLGRARAVRAA